MRFKAKMRKCYNCKHGGQQFKIDKLTHLHCEHRYVASASPWETLQVFSSACDKHEFKPSKVGTLKQP